MHKMVWLGMAVGARFDRIDHPVVHSNLAAMSAQVLHVIANRTLGSLGRPASTVQRHRRIAVASPRKEASSQLACQLTVQLHNVSTAAYSARHSSQGKTEPSAQRP